jgi:LPS-assembly protein
VIAQGRFDEKDWELKRQDTYMRTSYGPFSSTLGYTMTRYDTLAGLADTQQDILASVGVRVTNNWSVEGQVRYDIDDKRRVQDILQLKYQDECFVLTASYVETFIDNPGLELKPDRTLMLRFELKHLGQFNYKTDQLSHVFGDMKQGQ